MNRWNIILINIVDDVLVDLRSGQIEDIVILYWQ